MNAKTLRQIEEMKKQTIGVEVEMNNITRNKAAKIAAEFFGTGRFENTADRNGYCTWSAYDEQGREWKFQKDVSITGPDSEKCEMVTPILNYSDIEVLQELVRRLRKAGAKSDSTRGCGVHIHIGAKGHHDEGLEGLHIDCPGVFHYDRALRPFSYAEMDRGVVACVFIHRSEEIEHPVVRKKALRVESGNVFASYLADEGERVVLVALHLHHRVFHIRRHIRVSPPFAFAEQRFHGLGKVNSDSHGYFTIL